MKARVRDLESHELRVMDEQSELCDKISKLGDFLSKSKPPFIDDDQWFLLNLQLNAMAMYRDILAKRIKSFF